jgi:pSer/pThr/pTyr-binding forkhead associated (FHA) protein
LTEDGGEIVVRDLGSTNGTWINGSRVHRGRLKPGDEMSLGHHLFRLVSDAENGATPPERTEPRTPQGQPKIENGCLEKSASAVPAA